MRGGFCGFLIISSDQFIFPRAGLLCANDVVTFGGIFDFLDPDDKDLLLLPNDDSLGTTGKPTDEP